MNYNQLLNAAACVVSHLSEIERSGGPAASAVALLKMELALVTNNNPENFMTQKQYETAIRVSTESALNSGKISLPEIMGTLQLAGINAERLAYQHAVSLSIQEEQKAARETTNLILPPNTLHLPKH